jgi:hypothetical protein
MIKMQATAHTRSPPRDATGHSYAANMTYSRRSLTGTCSDESCCSSRLTKGTRSGQAVCRKLFELLYNLCGRAEVGHVRGYAAHGLARAAASAR